MPNSATRGVARQRISTSETPPNQSHRTPRTAPNVAHPPQPVNTAQPHPCILTGISLWAAYAMGSEADDAVGVGDEAGHIG